jgi:DNA mismatch repair protein MutS
LLSDAAPPAVTAAAEEAGTTVTRPGQAGFDSAAGERRLCALYGVATMAGFGTLGRADLAALGAIAAYLELTQRSTRPRLHPPRRESADSVMAIDAATRRSLELTASLSGGRQGSLIETLDRTVTAAGARLMEQRIGAPSRDIATIAQRLDAIAALDADRTLAEALRDALRGVPDMDRAISRLALDRGGPRDLGAIRAGLKSASRISDLMQGAALSGLLAQAAAELADDAALAPRLDATLEEDLPALLRDGGFVRPGIDAALDEVRTLRDEGRGVIARLQAGYAAETGIASLKIRHNAVLGYFIETTSTHAERMLSPPLAERFVHRQTTASQLRFVTLELAELETRILNAGARALEIERRLFDALRTAVLEAAPVLGRIAEALAEIDVATALADLAAGEGWVRPAVDDSLAFEVESGRHPVVERVQRRAGAPFVANDCLLSCGAAPAIWLLTGPNMAGKSTFLRQNALIAILAQAGSFVPAARARIGVVSQIFSRVGAADDLARGRSTFMVEMVETAAILNQADARAFVILDEIGRGTATWDGLSIAWATLEHLHDANRCRVLFATHYHELTALAARLPGAENATVAVKEWKGDVVFLHEVRRGAADRSYGVQVARLAGLPAPVVARARAVLERLERGDREGSARRLALVEDLPLFAASAAPPAPAPATPALTEVEERLRGIDPDSLTPRAALELVYALKALLK